MGLCALTSPGIRYFHTLRHLKASQLVYQVHYRVRRLAESRRGQSIIALTSSRAGRMLWFAPFASRPQSYEGVARFTFLNESKSFGGAVSAIDWEYGGNGKLWAYNLNYFDFLMQQGMARNTGLSLIRGFITALSPRSVGLEPYPISLRGINWIKFVSMHQVQDAEIDGSLYAQYQVLFRNLEYHLLGNHLLENAFSLLFGACYFCEEAWYVKSSMLLAAELGEQVLADGAHFELSPMYHQILLDRLLDCINLLQHNACFEGQEALLALLRQKADAMLGWLHAIGFADGSVPHLNDATDGIAPSSRELFGYAERLGIAGSAPASVPLRESGYRKYSGLGYECVIDIGKIGPDYILGHAHADTLGFVVQMEGRPFLVDTGTSTYEKGRVRDEERGTAAHNTVVVNRENSSDVWGGFRVGRRAGVRVLTDSPTEVAAEHDGYRRFGVVHRRNWRFEERKVRVHDVLAGKSCVAEARFHFDHALAPVINGGVVLADGGSLSFTGYGRVELVRYRQALGFNRRVDAWCVVVAFHDRLETVISLG